MPFICKFWVMNTEAAQTHSTFLMINKRCCLRIIWVLALLEPALWSALLKPSRALYSSISQYSDDESLFIKTGGIPRLPSP